MGRAGIVVSVWHSKLGVSGGLVQALPLSNLALLLDLAACNLGSVQHVMISRCFCILSEAVLVLVS